MTSERGLTIFAKGLKYKTMRNIRYLSALMTYKSGIVISLQSKILTFLFFNQKKKTSKQANEQTNKQIQNHKKPVD